MLMVSDFKETRSTFLKVPFHDGITAEAFKQSMTFFFLVAFVMKCTVVTAGGARE